MMEKGKKKIELLKQKVLKQKELKIEQISDDELLCVYLYTTNLFYTQFNKDCRSNNIVGWEPIIRNMLSCLRKLPFCWDICFRGVNNDESQYKIGATFAWEQFSSSSTSYDVAKKFSDPNKKGTIYEIKHWTGRRIESLSCYQTEAEILLMPCSYFKVTKVSMKDNFKYVTCEEVPLPWGKKHILWVDDVPEENKKK